MNNDYISFELYRNESLWLIESFGSVDNEVLSRLKLRPTVFKGQGLNRGFNLPNEQNINFGIEDRIEKWNFQFTKEKNLREKIQQDSAFEAISKGLIAIDYFGVFDIFDPNFVNEDDNNIASNLSYAIQYDKTSLDKIKNLMLSMDKYLSK